jgi:hypothetical protein
VASDVVYAYWEAKALRCVLIATHGPSTYAVNILQDDPELAVSTTLITQSCSGIAHGYVIARQLWRQLIRRG